ncbi:hypothetical protein LXL04_028467 [Taraxacum kok-saghyz]
MRVVFESQDQWEVEEQQIKEPDAMDEFTDEQETNFLLLKKKDQKAFYLLYHAVDEIIFEKTSSSNSAFETWDIEISKSYKLCTPFSKKTIISRDVLFDEDKNWNDTIKQDGNFSLVTLNDPSNKNKEITPTSPVSHVCNSHPSPQSPSYTSESETPPRIYRELNDLYANIRRLELIDFSDYALFSYANPLTYEQACQKKVWKIAMDEEISVILKNKLNDKGEVDRYKARLVVKGYEQKYRHDYKEVFAPVIRLEVVRLILALAAQNSWTVHQMDVNSAFLNGHLEEDVYIDQPKGYERKGRKIKNTLHSPKEPMENSHTNTPMEFGFKLSKDSRDKLVDSIIYRSLVGSLMYHTTTRLDMVFSVSILSRFMEAPKECQWEEGNRILKFIKDTLHYRIAYTKTKEFTLIGFFDSDFGGNIDDG